MFHNRRSTPDIGMKFRVFANDSGDRSSILGRVIPKTLKMVLDAALLNTQHYKVRIKGKVEQSKERISASPTPLCVLYSQLTLCAKWTCNVHYYRTYKERRNPGIRKHVTTSCSGTKPFY